MGRRGWGLLTPSGESARDIDACRSWHLTGLLRGGMDEIDDENTNAGFLRAQGIDSTGLSEREQWRRVREIRALESRQRWYRDTRKRILSGVVPSLPEIDLWPWLRQMAAAFQSRALVRVLRKWEANAARVTAERAYWKQRWESIAADGTLPLTMGQREAGVTRGIPARPWPDEEEIHAAHVFTGLRPVFFRAFPAVLAHWEEISANIERERKSRKLEQLIADERRNPLFRAFRF